MKILCLSGSLREQSSNTLLLRAAVHLAPPDVRLELDPGLGVLPHFNPDLDTETPPESVREFRARLAQADGVLISCPEYAHGVPGAFKNALDWVVSSGELVDKPVALINASATGGTIAQAQLLEILRTMTADVFERESLIPALVRQGIDAGGAITDPALADKVRRCLASLAARASARRSSPPR
jgi:NAD(P)H-dependent FMN reductase